MSIARVDSVFPAARTELRRFTCRVGTVFGLSIGVRRLACLSLSPALCPMGVERCVWFLRLDEIIKLGELPRPGLQMRLVFG